MLLRRVNGKNTDSDDSISDEDVAQLNEDDQQSNLPNNHELPLPVRLDLLKGRICNQNPSSEKPLEDDEVEMPDFKETVFRDLLGEVVANSTDDDEEDIVSEDDQVSIVLSTRHLQKNGPQFIRDDPVKDTNRKSEALLRFKESASCSGSHASCSNTNTSGIWSKAKPRLSLPSVSHKYGHVAPSVSTIDRLPEIMNTVDSRASASLDGNHLENDERMEIKSDTKPAETEALPHEFNLPSIADLFDKLQHKTDLYPHYIQRREETVQLFQKNSRSHLRETVVNSEDSPEPLNSGSSSDHEVNDQHMEITFPGKKMQTMADRFQEAVGSSSVMTEGSHAGALNKLRTGIFGKLQQVIQKEKERDMDFWKKLQAGSRPDGELGCVAVNIISRYLDGKLTVCHCSISKYTENFLLQADKMGVGDRKSGQRTIIFSSRVCDNVDLEVGSLIRIHPPWKEVQVGNDNIILCAYFSEICPQIDSCS